MFSPDAPENTQILLSAVPASIAAIIVKAVQGKYGMLNIRMVYPIGAADPDIEVWSTGWSFSQFHKVQEFAIGVSYGVTLQRGF
jgi:hypothetical protein